MKEFRNTAVLLVLCLGLWVYLGWFTDIDSLQPLDEARRLTDLSRRDLRRIEMTRGEASFALERDREPTADESPALGWVVVLDGARLPADPGPLDTLLRKLTNLEVQRTIDPEPADLSRYALDEPLAEVRFRVRAAGGEETVAFKVGAKSPVGSLRYLAREGDPAVYGSSSWELDPLLKDAAYFREKRVFTDLDADALTRIEVTLEGPEAATRVFTREGEGEAARWWITEPTRARADTAEMRLLVADMKALRAESFLSADPSSRTTYRLDAPDVVARFLGPGDEVRTLSVGGKDPEKPNRIGVLLEGAPQPVTVAADLLKRLRAPLFDFRHKRVLEDLGEGANRLEVADISASVVATRGMEVWTLPSGADVTEAVEGMLKELRELRATGFLEGDLPAEVLELLGTPDLAIVVGDVTVDVAEQGAKLLLRRSDDPRVVEATSDTLLEVFQAFLAAPRDDAAGAQ